MPDGLTQLILKPTGPLAAGVVLFGVVWGTFKGIEGILNDDTKLEIAVWLLGRKKFGPRVQPWPDAFTKILNQVFGRRYFSWTCLWRLALVSVIASYLTGFVFAVLHGLALSDMFTQTGFIVFVITTLATVLPSYLSLLETRYVLSCMRRSANAKVWAGWLVLDLLSTIYTGILGTLLSVGIVRDKTDTFGDMLFTMFTAVLVHPLDMLSIFLTPNHGLYPLLVPPLLTSVWLWLYAGSGFLLKAARRFDIGFDWFNRHIDIEKKPLQSIGLVAGVLVAVVYWAAVLVSRVVGRG